MRTLRVTPGTPLPRGVDGAVTVRDLVVGGERWPKGRRLSAIDAERLADPSVAVDAGARARPGAPGTITLLVLERGDVHEDDAAVRLAAAVAGPGTRLRGPAESRVDLVADASGVLRVRIRAVERLDAIDPLEVFTLYDGQTVAEGDLVACAKIGPHVVAESVLARGVEVASRLGPLVRVAPFLRRRVAVVVKESVRAMARARFEATIRDKVETLGSVVTDIAYVADEPDAVEAALRARVRGRGRADIVLTAGAASTDPTDPFFVAIDRLGGRVVRRGVPAHPGSMVWLARVGRSDLLGLPTCGAYSRATAADLLLPRLLTGERASAAMAASLGHGGVLTRAMRFRFPPYARDLEAPEP